MPCRRTHRSGYHLCVYTRQTKTTTRQPTKWNRIISIYVFVTSNLFQAMFAVRSFGWLLYVEDDGFEI